MELIHRAEITLRPMRIQETTHGVAFIVFSMRERKKKKTRILLVEKREPTDGSILVIFLFYLYLKIRIIYIFKLLYRIINFLISAFY